MPSAANYLGTAAYWTERVRKEGEESDQGFDWLLAGDDAGFKAFIAHAAGESAAALAPLRTTPRVLHLGPGSSTLSLWMRDLVGDPGRVVHVDFAESAKELGERWERERWPDAPEGQRMRWLTGDLLDIVEVLAIPRAVERLEEEEGRGEVEGPVLFDVLVDKGTLDAVSCAESAPPLSEVVERAKKYAPEMSAKVLKQPIYSSLVVALNLATICRPGAAWVMLSYSGTRFDAFTARVKEGTPSSLEELASRLWRLEVRRELEAEEKQDGGGGGEGETSDGAANGPKVYHWVYLLRRTDVPF
ncbi:hypothetical protein BX600DRAFT_83140 [Xylariales sp. PMI_506]|nr:hypothetical protein BX600DRAFT_83140 [Xylariales sp. PMI_506]